MAVLGAGLAMIPIAGAAAAAPSPVTISTCDSSSPSSITNGSTIDPGGCLLSPDHQYELIMQADGNLVLYYQSQADPLWDTGVPNDVAYDAGAFATMQSDGNFVLYSQYGGNGSGVLWASGTNGQAPNANLVLQDDGNLVIYATNPAGSPYAAWSTNTEDLRGYELQANQVLEPGQYLESQDGQYGLEMGTGGVLVLFTTSTGNTEGDYRCPIWSEPAITAASPVTYQYNTTNPIATSSSQSTFAVGAYPYASGDTTTETPVANSYLTMQSDGNLVMYSTGATPDDPWASGTTANPGAYAELQNDGNLVIYSAGGAPLWSSYTSASGENRGWALCTGSTLQIGQRINAVPWYNGDYLTMQSDCNLVLYTSSGTPTWSTNTDIDVSNNFSKGSNDSTLDGLPDNPAYFSGCYAVMGADGSLSLVAPDCTNVSATCKSASNGLIPGEFWNSGTQGDATTTYMPPGSFGPFLAYPTNGAALNLVSAAGYLVDADPVVDNPHNPTTEEVLKEVGKFALMVFFAFL